MPAVAAALISGGFLPAGTAWTAPTQAQLNNAVATMSERLETPLRFLAQGA